MVPVSVFEGWGRLIVLRKDIQLKLLGGLVIGAQVHEEQPLQEDAQGRLEPPPVINGRLGTSFGALVHCIRKGRPG